MIARTRRASGAPTGAGTTADKGTTMPRSKFEPDRAGAAALALAAVLLATTALAEPASVTILQINDWDRMGEAGGRGGFARLMAVLEAERAANEHVVFVHAGDAISPSLLSGFDSGAHMIDLINRAAPHAFALGNHEFDFGPDVLKELLAEATFPVVNSNVRDADGGLFARTVETLMIEVAGYRFGLLGLTTPDTVAIASPGYATFDPILETTARVARQLRDDGAEIVIALAHTGIDEDFALLRQRAVDIILTGHDHHLMTFYDGRVAMVESASQADYVTAIDLRLDRVESGGATRVVWSPSFRTLDTALYTPDPAALEVLQGYEDKLSAELDVPIGPAVSELDSRRAAVRGQETAIGNLIADAIRAAVDADVAITNGGGIRGDRIYDAGTELLRRDIQTELPFGNKTVKLEVTGADILAALENGFSQVDEGAGRFPQVSGMTVAWDRGKPAGSRVVEVVIEGAPLDPAGTYSLATNDFMANGGDGYTVFSGKPNLIDPNAAQFMASQVIDHIAAAGGANATIEGRIVPAN
jgi:5'-nucleotidase / UDP-sugar diphosphatase